ncbi:MAG: serine/threonine-protein kinase [Gammaproteobacteria bacterium]
MQAKRWEQVAELFAELTTVPPDQRASFLHEACGNDTELREELVSLLQAHEVSVGPLDGAPGFAANDADTDVPSELGTQVGPYRLIRPIGEGGMGSVWLAERADGVLKRAIALKRPHVSWIGTLAERMAQERDILASLEHPNIARLYDAGVTVDGRPYLALEYVEGVPITQYCDRLQFTVTRRLELFLQVLDAVRYAHAHLVIHRDIKPSNILVSADGRVHLLDFGIAKMLHRDAPADAGTQWGGGALTPDYASPEQISGRVVSTASDVYSLGVMLAELLAGGRPYELKRDSRAALEDAILEAEPRVPSKAVDLQAAKARGVTEHALTRALRGDLDNIVLKALRKNPADRYANAELLAQDITRHLHGEAILAQPGSPWYYASKFLRRHKLAVASAAIVVFALVAGAAVALFQAHQARLAAARAEQVKSFALAMLQSADTDSGAGAATTAVELLQSASKRVETELAGRPAIAAELMTAIGYGLIGQDRVEDAAALLKKAVALSTEANGADDALTLAAQAVYGEALYNLGKNDETIALLKTTASKAHRLGERHTEIDAWRWLSSAQIDAGDVEAAVVSARAAVAALPAKPESDRAVLFDATQAHVSLGNALTFADQPGVIEEAREALRFAQALAPGRETEYTLHARVMLGQGLVRQGQVAAGLRELKAAYAGARALFGDGYHQTEIAANLVGTALLAGGDIPAATEALTATYDSIMQHQVERGVYAVAMGHYGLAAALAAQKDDSKALPHLQEAARLFAEVGGPTAPLALRSRSAGALSLARLGRLDEADREFARLADAPFAGADASMNKQRLGILRSLQGRHDEAVTLERASWEGLKDIPAKHIQAQALARLGTVLVAAGRPTEAIAPLEQSLKAYDEAQPVMSPDHAEAIATLGRARAAVEAGAGTR